jgi:hypothetical protein
MVLNPKFPIVTAILQFERNMQLYLSAFWVIAIQLQPQF